MMSHFISTSRPLISSLLLALSLATLASNPPSLRADDPGVTVECHGQIRTGLVAIGGETTGTTISFDRIVWELKLPDEATRKLANENNKKPVTVTGKLRRVKGQAVSIRWILDVEKLTTRDASRLKEGANLTVNGILRANDTPDSPTGIEIAAGEMVWPLDLSADHQLKTKAVSFLNKPVVVRARLERDSTADSSSKRTILRVKKLEAAEEG